MELDSKIVFYVNRERRVITDCDPTASLSSYLHGTGLRGTKTGCNEGGCGACTVLMSCWNNETQRVEHKAVLSCLTPLHSVHRTLITTIESLSEGGALHPLQARIAELHGTQCGYCTPGIIMTLFAFFLNHPNASVHEVEHSLDANLCRCTGYRPIADAAKSFAVDFEDWYRSCLAEVGTPAAQATAERLVVPRCQPFQLPHPFPAEFCTAPRLLIYSAPSVSGPTVEVIHPTTLEEARTMYRDGTVPVSGSSELELIRNVMKQGPARLMLLTSIASLRYVRKEEEATRIGAAATLNEVRDALRDSEISVHRALCHQLQIFANSSVRNVATIPGNIVNASPIADTVPVLAAVGATIEVLNLQTGERRSCSARGFNCALRRTLLQPGEIIVEIVLPHPARADVVSATRAYKVSRRLEDDISQVNSCLHLEFSRAELLQGRFVVKQAGFALGGMAATSLVVPVVETALVGSVLSHEVLSLCLEHMRALQVDQDAPGLAADFRLVIAASLFYRSLVACMWDAARSVGLGCEVIAAVLGDAHAGELTDGLTEGDRRLSETAFGFQTWGDEPMHPLAHPPAPAVGEAVHRSMPIKSAPFQVTGTADYASSMKLDADTLFGGVVCAGVPRARLLSIDRDAVTEIAGRIPGFVTVITAEDVPEHGHRGCGVAAQDEPVIVACGECAENAGAALLMVLATTQDAAVAAAAAIQGAMRGPDSPVKIEKLQPVLTVKEAMERFEAGDKSAVFGGGPRSVRHGSLSAFDECDFVDEGTLTTPVQEHFYLETQVSVASIGEGGEVSMVTSSQHLDAVAGTVANLLDTSRNHVYVETRRLGGGFGGKEGNLVHAGLAALGTYVTHRPVCLWLERQFDLPNTGKRHPMEMHYKIGVKDGRVHVFQARLLANAGPFLDLSLSVCERAALHLDNAYYFPHAAFDVYACRTNLQSNTAFRGFGAPQAILLIETAIERLAARYQLDPIAIRSKSLYAENEPCPYGQEVTQTAVLHRCWSETVERAEYAKLRRQVDAFNAEHVYRKRGLAAMPLKFGISFTQSFLNQASSTVNVYKDGTVLVFAQVTEMGQAAFTKIAQLVADALGVDVANVHLRRTTTEVLSNASPTSATTATDLHGMAAMLAAQEIAKRLEPFKTEGRTMAQVCTAAWLARVPLNATAFYATPMTGYDFATGLGQPFAYYAFGAAVGVVEIDTLTGAHRILRADVCYDAGDSLNPAIDIGQIEGAFVQGTGWLTSEEFMVGARWDAEAQRLRPTGQALSVGPGTYKIPGLADIPQDFRVRLMDNAPNPRAVRLSKGVGEPPFCLGSVVFLALADAVRACQGKPLRAPATPESVRCAIPDSISKAVLGAEPRATSELLDF